MRIMAVLALGVALGASAAGSLGAFWSAPVWTPGCRGNGRSGPDPGQWPRYRRPPVGRDARRPPRRWPPAHGGDDADPRILRLSAVRGRAAGPHPGGPALAFGAGWAWPGLFNLAIVLANPASPAAATGVTQTGTYLGAVAGPLLFGFVAEHLSYGWSWTLAAVMSWMAAAAVWAGRGMLRRSRLTAAPLATPAGVIARLLR